jgi:hypothetical protein
MENTLIEKLDLEGDSNIDSEVPVADGEQLETISVVHASIDDADDKDLNADESDEPSKFEMPDKFKGKTAEEIAKSYLELEKLKDRKKETEVVDKPVDDKPEIIEKPVVDGPMTVEQYQETWQVQGGGLTDRQWSELSKTTGISIDTLKAYEHMVKEKNTVMVEEHDAQIYRESGGKAKYDEMIEWANGNLSESQIEGLNAQLDNPTFYKQGVAILKSTYEASVGFEPQVKLKNVANPSNADLLGDDEFRSEQEAFVAMRDPRYETDAAWTRQFDAKLARLLKRSKK